MLIVKLRLIFKPNDQPQDKTGLMSEAQPKKQFQVKGNLSNPTGQWKPMSFPLQSNSSDMFILPKLTPCPQLLLQLPVTLVLRCAPAAKEAITLKQCIQMWFMWWTSKKRKPSPVVPERFEYKHRNNYKHIWRFPEMGVPPNHPFQWDFPLINHPFQGTPIYGNPHIIYIIQTCCFSQPFPLHHRTRPRKKGAPPRPWHRPNGRMEPPRQNTIEMKVHTFVILCANICHMNSMYM